MEKELKVCTAVRDKNIEDSIIDTIMLNKWKHSYVTSDDITSEQSKDGLLLIIEDSYQSILDLVIRHNECELNFLPVIIIGSGDPKYSGIPEKLQYPEKYFYIRSPHFPELMVQTVRTMDKYRDAYKYKKFSQFREFVADAYKRSGTFSGFMNGILPRLLKLLFTDRGSIMLLNERGNLVIEASTKKDLIGLEIGYKPDSVAWTVIDTGRPVFVEDIEKDPRFKKGTGYSKDYFLSLPLFVNDEIAGVFNLTDKITSLLFDSDDYDNANALISIIEPYIMMHRLQRK